VTKSTLTVTAPLLGAGVLCLLPLHAQAAAAKAQIEARNIRVEFDTLPRSRVVAKFDGNEIPLGGFTVYDETPGTVSGPTGRINAQFEKRLLVRADPE
jgi:hypothetical protein